MFKVKQKICEVVKCNFGTVYVILLAFLIGFQMWHYYEFKTRIQGFMSVGPRFTAFHGQGLCYRVQNLETITIGKAEPCTYIEEGGGSNK